MVTRRRVPVRAPNIKGEAKRVEGQGVSADRFGEHLVVLDMVAFGRSGGELYHQTNEQVRAPEIEAAKVLRDNHFNINMH